MRGQPQPGLRLIATMASMRSWLGPFRARPAALPRRKQLAVLSIAQRTVEMQQGGRFQNDGGTKDTCRAQEQGTQAGDDPIRGTQVGRALAPAIEDEQLMPDQHGLGDNGAESTRPHQSGQGDDQMNEYDSEVAHSGNGINTSKTAALRPIWQFAIEGERGALGHRSCPTAQRFVSDPPAVPLLGTIARRSFSSRCAMPHVSRPAGSLKFNLRGPRSAVPANGCLVTLMRWPHLQRIQFGKPAQTVNPATVASPEILPISPGRRVFSLTSPYHGYRSQPHQSSSANPRSRAWSSVDEHFMG